MFLYNVISDYSKENDIFVDTGTAGKITTLKGYLDSLDEVIFEAISTALSEILTMNSIDYVSDEYIPYLAYFLGYNWNFNLSFDIQRTLLKSILQIYKRKGTKFAVHFNLYQLDPNVSLYEPYKDLFILDKSKYGEDHLPSREYYSYGILVIKLTKFIPDVLDLVEYVRPAGWKIIVEFSYGVFYSFHIKIMNETRTTLVNSSYYDFNYSYLNTYITNNTAIANGTTEYATTTGLVGRSASSNIDIVSTYVKIKYIKSIDKVYQNKTIFTPVVDYNIGTNNATIIWTNTGKSKIEANSLYYIDYTRKIKIEAADEVKNDSNIRDVDIANVEKDKYIYNEFGVSIYKKLTDSQYEEQYVNSIMYTIGSYMPVTMVGHTFMCGFYQPAVFNVDNASGRYALNNYTYWEPQEYKATYVAVNKFSVLYNRTRLYLVNTKLRLNETIYTNILSAVYDETNNITLITVSDNIVPETISKLYMEKHVVFNNDVVYQKDTKRYYRVIDYNNLTNEEGYSIYDASYALNQILTYLSVKEISSSLFILNNLATHHILYEYDTYYDKIPTISQKDSILTMYRFSLQYSSYLLLNGIIYAEGGETVMFTIPNGIYSVKVTTVGGGGGSSFIHSISGGYKIAVGGGGGSVRYEYPLAVTPGDTLIISAGIGGKIGNNGETSQVKIRSINNPATEVVADLTVAPGGKASTDVLDLNLIDLDNLYGISWYGGEAGGQRSGSGASIWSTNKCFNDVSNINIMSLLYADYGYPGISSGGRTIVTSGIIGGGGGSYGIGAGLYGSAGYGGGGCATVDEGHGGTGFAKIEYDPSLVIDD